MSKKIIGNTTATAMSVEKIKEKIGGGSSADVKAAIKDHDMSVSAHETLIENYLDYRYATPAYVAQEITKVNTGGSVDLTGYATEKFVEEKIAEYDNAVGESLEEVIDAFATKEELVEYKGLVEQAVGTMLDSKADKAHDHDDRYATSDYADGFTEANGNEEIKVKCIVPIAELIEGNNTTIQLRTALSVEVGHWLCRYSVDDKGILYWESRQIIGVNGVSVTIRSSFSKQCKHTGDFSFEGAALIEDGVLLYDDIRVGDYDVELTEKGKVAIANRAIGFENTVSGNAYSEGNNNIVTALSSHAEGSFNKVNAVEAHAEGSSNTVTGKNGHAEGHGNTVSGVAAHAEGISNVVTQDYGHVEGSANKVNGQSAHAEGYLTEANGIYSHAEGWETKANKRGSHAEGHKTTADGDFAHAEGDLTQAIGADSHAEGGGAIAKGNYSHAEGLYTISNGDAQHVEGKYNIEDTAGKYAHIVGNGKRNENRSNAYTLDWSGNGWFAGNVKVGSDGDILATQKNVTAAVEKAGGSFMGKYGETEYYDMFEAATSGKAVMLNISGNILPLTKIDYSVGLEFGQVQVTDFGLAYVKATCSIGNNWEQTSYPL